MPGMMDPLRRGEWRRLQDERDNHRALWHLAGRTLIVAHEFLEAEVCELMQAVSRAFARARFKTYTS
jgi:hypothetical protein